VLLALSVSVHTLLGARPGGSETELLADIGALTDELFGLARIAIASNGLAPVTDRISNHIVRFDSNDVLQAGTRSVGGSL